MIKDLSDAALAVIGGAFTLAIISVLVSQRANTSAVIQASGSAVGNIIGEAVSPVTGQGGSFGGGGASGGSGALGTLQSISGSLTSLNNTFGSYV